MKLIKTNIKKLQLDETKILTNKKIISKIFFKTNLIKHFKFI